MKNLTKLKKHPKAYKVIFRLNNGDRVSPMFPNKHPLRNVYIHNGKKNIFDEVFVYVEKMNFSIKNINNIMFSYNELYQELYSHIKGNLEFWEVEYETLYKCKKIIDPYQIIRKLFNYNPRVLQFIKQNKNYEQRMEYPNIVIYKNIDNLYVVNKASLKTLIGIYPLK